MRLKFIAIFLFFGILGCKSYETSDLIGTWVIADWSREYLPTELQKAQAKIILNANGTFIASDMPIDFYFHYHDRDVHLESGSGVWKIKFIQKRQQIELEFLAITGWRKDELPLGWLLDISNRSLYYYMSDPDLGHKISFERQ